MTYKTGSWGVQAKERDSERKEYFKLYNQEHYQQNKEKYKLRAKEYAQRRPDKMKFNSYSQDARKRGLVFELSFSDFMKLWGAACSYCGDNIDTIGIDRIDNSIGYVIDNIASCCSQCNFMKRSYTKSEFIKKCQSIAAHSKKGGM